MKVKGDRSCLYRAVASCIISFCIEDVWMGIFPPVKKPGITQGTFEVVNDLKELISERDNEMLEKAFEIYSDKEVHGFTYITKRMGFCNGINLNEH